MERSPISVRQRACRGFSMVELSVSLAILLILSAIAVPTIMRSYRAYVLSSSSSQVSGLLKFTRFEAIRRNTKIGFRAQQSGAIWTVWTDSDGNGAPGPGEAQAVLPALINVLPSGAVPSSAPIVTAIGSASPGLTVQSGSNTLVTFDGRGAVDFGASSPTVYVYYLGNASLSDLGARAIVVLPSGIVQVWSSATGNWVQVG